jgi:hypothetical protein
MHFVSYVVFAVLRKSGRLTGVAGLLIEYVRLKVYMYKNSLLNL